MDHKWQESNRENDIGGKTVTHVEIWVDNVSSGDARNVYEVLAAQLGPCAYSRMEEMNPNFGARWTWTWNIEGDQSLISDKAWDAVNRAMTQENWWVNANVE